ncbi:hypothetical protein BURK2_04129 [Burkholderiales bacterium]|nr:MAG: DUF47 domain-containing protein [Burkholderiales bacterium]CAG1010885.1 hypothetical protein BURK2_04129 [Burkholderiales bacterium]
MIGKFMPREGRFFDNFVAHADLIVAGAREMNSLIVDVGNLELRTKNIERLERQADEITHQTVAMLHHTFITPLDRDEIHQLITGMDDILDLMEDVAQCLFLYDITELTAEAVKLAEICVSCTERVREAVGMLSNMKKGEAILVICNDIDRLESEADYVMRSAMAKLFREEGDVRQLIKMKEIYQLLESVTDRCEDVANIVEGIVLENV